MQKDLDEIEFLFPGEWEINEFLNQPVSEPFSEESVNFLNSLSLEINRNKSSRRYSDVVSFAFFCRKANLLRLKKEYEYKENIMMGRGILFHIAPSNVPMNFAYSLAIGILSGNQNIVRVPTKEFEQVNLISEAISKLSREEEHKCSTKRIVLIRYDKKSSATAYFSSICDVRIIWGGDKTIENIRMSSLPARSYDITFADRYSFCLINADNYIEEADPVTVASDFYNDTYLFDQNACSSPHLVVWLGSQDNVEKAKEVFWGNLLSIVREKYKLQSVTAVDKLTAFYLQASGSEKILKAKMPDNYIFRIELDKLTGNLENYRCAGGYFLEYHASTIFELTSVINNKYQTMAYYGIGKEELREFMKKTRPKGVDRIVPVGKTSEFSITWDGYELINALSRCCEIK